jgi:hypothetical protein
MTSRGKLSVAGPVAGQRALSDRPRPPGPGGDDAAVAVDPQAETPPPALFAFRNPRSGTACILLARAADGHVRFAGAAGDALRSLARWIACESDVSVLAPEAGRHTGAAR